MRVGFTVGDVGSALGRLVGVVGLEDGTGLGSGTGKLYSRDK